MASCFVDRHQRYAVARALARLLRESAPSILAVDPYGYMSIDAVIGVMQNDNRDVSAAHIAEIVMKDAQSRFEIVGHMIRARAGHNYVVLPPPSSAFVPPQYLYHGTSATSAEAILIAGLRQMNKARVHLTSTVERARRVGLRKAPDPTILRIRAKAAHSSGVRFWKSGQVSDDGEIILSDEIPPIFVETSAPETAKASQSQREGGRPASRQASLSKRRRKD